MNNILKEKEKIYNILKSCSGCSNFFLHFNKNNKYLFVSNIIRFTDNIIKIEKHLQQNNIDFYIKDNLLYINPDYTIFNDDSIKYKYKLSFNHNNCSLKFIHIYRVIIGFNISNFIDPDLGNNIIKMKYINEKKYYDKIIKDLIEKKKNKNIISSNLLSIINDIISNK